jgi:hypothetical protein
MPEIRTLTRYALVAQPTWAPQPVELHRWVHCPNQNEVRVTTEALGCPWELQTLHVAHPTAALVKSGPAIAVV